MYPITSRLGCFGAYNFSDCLGDVFFIILYMSINQAAGKKITLWGVRILKRFSKKNHFEIERRAIEAMHGFQNSMRVMIKDRRVLMFGLPLSFLIWFMEIIRVYIVFSSFGTPVPLGIIGAVFVIATLIGYDPTSTRWYRCC